MTSTLLRPLRLPNGTVLQNRLAKSAMSERLAGESGAANDALVHLYRRWSAGGAGLLVTGNVMVDKRAIGESGNVVVEDDSHAAELALWARAATSSGNQAFVQINHPGRQSPRMLSRRPVAPSAVAMRGAFGTFARPRALEDDEVVAIIDRFAKTAAIVQAAGFTGVQIHAAHGYLVNQFLSPLTNLREDRWGGSPDNRRRFLIEIVRRVRASVGKEFPVAVKLNSADFQRGGFDEAESMAVVEALDAEGIDLLEISGGTYESAAMFDEAKAAHPSSRAREAFFLEYAEKVRDKTRVPLMVTGGFRTARGMSEAIDGGAVDLVGLARPLAIEPDLPARLLVGTADARPIHIATGIKKLDALIQGAFYQAQIRRIARGLEPKPDLSRLAAVLAYVRGPRPLRARPRITRSRSSNELVELALNLGQIRTTAMRSLPTRPSTTATRKCFLGYPGAMISRSAWLLTLPLVLASCEIQSSPRSAPPPPMGPPPPGPAMGAPPPGAPPPAGPPVASGCAPGSVCFNIVPGAPGPLGPSRLVVYWTPPSDDEKVQPEVANLASLSGAERNVVLPLSAIPRPGRTIRMGQAWGYVFVVAASEPNPPRPKKAIGAPNMMFVHAVNAAAQANALHAKFPGGIAEGTAAYFMDKSQGVHDGFVLARSGSVFELRICPTNAPNCDVPFPNPS